MGIGKCTKAAAPASLEKPGNGPALFSQVGRVRWASGPSCSKWVGVSSLTWPYLSYQSPSHPPWPQGTSGAHQVFALLVPLLEALIPNKAKQVTFFIPSGFCSLQSSLRNNSWPLHSKEHLSHGVYHISLQILHLSMVSAHEGRDLLCPFAC